MIDQTWTIESAVARDLSRINRVIAEAISAWTVSDRVKRLALPLYHYELADLEELHIQKAVDTHGTLLGVIAWGAAGPNDAQGRESTALLHGIYVNPSYQHLGIGTSLLEHAREQAERCGYRGFIVKASKDAAGFFERLGCTREEHAAESYPHLFFLPFQTAR